MLIALLQGLASLRDDSGWAESPPDDVSRAAAAEPAAKSGEISLADVAKSALDLVFGGAVVGGFYGFLAGESAETAAFGAVIGAFVVVGLEWFPVRLLTIVGVLTLAHLVL